MRVVSAISNYYCAYAREGSAVRRLPEKRPTPHADEAALHADETAPHAVEAAPQENEAASQEYEAAPQEYEAAPLAQIH